MYLVINNNEYETQGADMKGKIDINKVVKKTSREFFAGMDTRTKSVPSKKAYKRKEKHRSLADRY